MAQVKEVTATMLRRQLADALRHVLSGSGPVHITKHGKTIAVMAKVGAVESKEGEVLADVVVAKKLAPLPPGIVRSEGWDGQAELIGEILHTPTFDLRAPDFKLQGVDPLDISGTALAGDDARNEAQYEEVPKFLDL